MSDNIVTLPQRVDPRVVLRCPCGCLTHYLRADGLVECAFCEEVVTHSPNDWRARLPVTPADPADVEDGDIIDCDLADETIAQRRVLKVGQDAVRAGNLAVLVVVTREGAIRIWNDLMDGEARRIWFEDKLSTIRETVFRYPRP